MYRVTWMSNRHCFNPSVVGPYRVHLNLEKKVTLFCLLHTQSKRGTPYCPARCTLRTGNRAILSNLALQMPSIIVLSYFSSQILISPSFLRKVQVVTEMVVKDSESFTFCNLLPIIYSYATVVN